ncbi:DUF5924 family protein [Pseudomonas sp. N040]|uniref:DUF5924 family protein n=1 Tax=Pseudomonas sp. N040 TaxID=2785325 RepID=UPI0018A263E0|nr:DUF5924 family protein [Pseudomonas sp. N040]MBF7728801.1 DUF2914 domain-containing protein [Pseudomonas sp. N040]MBW7012441.1 DUF2914 domain-containing protein [Pseudomonas sp. N040]
MLHKAPWLAQSRLAIFLQKQLLALIALNQRYPWVVALYGFLSGVASFVMVDRQARLASLVAILMLASWLLLVLENAFNQHLARWFGIELPSWLARFVTQMIHQQSLFFVLPFFAMSTTWNSGQLVFTCLLGAAALISIIDPLYYDWLAPRRWLYLAYHSLTLFAVQLTAMPIILHQTTAQSYQLALLSTVLLAFPSLVASLQLRRHWRWLAVPLLTAALLLAGWLARPWIPPATLRLNEVAISLALNDQARVPGQSLQQLSSADLHRQGLFAFTAISAPRGLAERIYHVWRRNGVEVDRIALDIQGGSNDGYRAWSHKQNFPQQADGKWTVEVVTDAGQMIGVLRFVVSP